MAVLQKVPNIKNQFHKSFNAYWLKIRTWLAAFNQSVIAKLGENLFLTSAQGLLDTAFLSSFDEPNKTN